MHRRKFLSLVSGAVAAVAGGLGLVSGVSPLKAITFGKGKPHEKTLVLKGAASPFVGRVRFDDLIAGINVEASTISGYDPNGRQYLAYSETGFVWVPKGPIKTGELNA